MSLEENFHGYYNNFGIEQDLGKMRHLFDEVYHDDFVNELDGEHPLDKDQLWRNETAFIERGTGATVLRQAQDSLQGTSQWNHPLRLRVETQDRAL